MAITLNTNVPSLVAQSSLSNSTWSVERAMQQLTTGMKINSAGDDAACLVISQNMTIQMNGSDQAMENVLDAQNFAAVAESGMTSIGDHLQRINELLIQGASDTNSEESREAILVEIKQRVEDIDVIAQATSFNGREMLDGSFDPADPFIVQVGPYSNEDPANPLNTLDITGAFTNCRISILGIGSTMPDGGSVNTGIMLPPELDPDNAAFDPTGDNFRAYMDTIQSSITDISEARGLLGGYLNRMTTTYDNLDRIIESVATARSRITDTDVAEASSELVKQQILQQTSASMLTQANQIPQIALSLI